MWKAYFSTIPVGGCVEECPSGLVLCTCILDRKTTSGLVQLPPEVDWQFGRNHPHQNRQGRRYQPFFRLVIYQSASLSNQKGNFVVKHKCELFHFLESHYSTRQGHQKMIAKNVRHKQRQHISRYPFQLFHSFFNPSPPCHLPWHSWNPNVST